MNLEKPDRKEGVCKWNTIQRKYLQIVNVQILVVVVLNLKKKNCNGNVACDSKRSLRCLCQEK